MPKPPNIHHDGVARIAAFRIALQRFEQTSDRVVRQSGLTPRQHLLLLALEGRHAGSASIGTLSQELLLAQSTVTELVGRAERVGLIQRERSGKDLRVAHLRLTEEGERRLALAVHGHDEQRAELKKLLDALGD